jgi:hypothetical protein
MDQGGHPVDQGGHPVDRHEVSNAAFRMDQGHVEGEDVEEEDVEGEDEVSAAAYLRLVV